MKQILKKAFTGNKAIIICITLLVILLLKFIYSAFTPSTSLIALPIENFWLWRFLGRLHPMAVHFPVGLLLFAAFMELFTLKKFSSSLRPGIQLLVIAGTVSALVSAFLGYFLSTNGDYSANLSIHQWLGIVAAFLGIIVWQIQNRILVKNQYSLIKTYRIFLFITAFGVLAAGHYGASLTHGDDYLTSTLPWNEEFEDTNTPNFDLASFKMDTVKLTLKQETELNLKVRAIFAHNCYKCHGDEKIKGELRLDRKNMAFKGGENGPVIIPGNAAESELFRRINLPSNHKEIMPSKGKKLSDGDIAVINYWIEKGAPWPDGPDKNEVFNNAALAPRNPALPPAQGIHTNPVDRWTNQYFVKNKIEWPELVDDRTYLRRIFLDIIGLLPSQEDVKAFSKDNRPDKRAIWSRKLLDRKDDYAINWLTFWNDALRNDYTGTGYITNGRYAITDWLYQSIQSNMPYDQFVKELVSPKDDRSKGFVEGIKWRGVVNASQRTEMQAAQNVSQVFLGLNLKCASCHNSLCFCQYFC
jgi:uncharacterized membrane protein/mono/diheme cytochrome c family protein